MTGWPMTGVRWHKSFVWSERFASGNLGQVHREVVYGLTSLSPHRAPARRLNHFVRRHWAVENEVHWRRDVTLGEDSCQSRTGKVPQMLATLNNVVLALMQMLAVSNVAGQMREFAAFPEQALRLLLSS